MLIGTSASPRPISGRPAGDVRRPAAPCPPACPARTPPSAPWLTYAEPARWKASIPFPTRSPRRAERVLPHPVQWVDPWPLDLDLSQGVGCGDRSAAAFAGQSRAPERCRDAKGYCCPALSVPRNGMVNSCICGSLEAQYIWQLATTPTGRNARCRRGGPPADERCGGVVG